MASGDGTQVLTSQPGISYSGSHHSSPLCLLVCVYLGEDEEWRVLLIYIPVDTAKCFTLPPETHRDHHLVLVNHIFLGGGDIASWFYLCFFFSPVANEFASVLCVCG